jgi:hypothetical protein
LARREAGSNAGRPKTLSPEILAEAAAEMQRVLDQQPQLGDFE